MKRWKHIFAALVLVTACYGQSFDGERLVWRQTFDSSGDVGLFTWSNGTSTSSGLILRWPGVYRCIPGPLDIGRYYALHVFIPEDGQICVPWPTQKTVLHIDELPTGTVLIWDELGNFYVIPEFSRKNEAAIREFNYGVH